MWASADSMSAPAHPGAAAGGMEPRFDLGVLLAGLRRLSLRLGRRRLEQAAFGELRGAPRLRGAPLA
eukprot:4966792-Prymnesium_polylepis.1